MKVLDLFCGAGGLASGFSKAGFNVTGVDNFEDVGQTFKQNKWGRFVRLDLSWQLATGNYPLIVGGPPCKPWSNVNTTRRGSDHHDYELVHSFFRHVKYHEPKFFLLENVLPLGNDKVLETWIDRLSSINRPGKPPLSYKIRKHVVRYSDFGSASNRCRLVVLGARDFDPDQVAEELAGFKKPGSTVRETIGELQGNARGKPPDHVWPNLKTIGNYRNLYKTGQYGWYTLGWDEAAPSFGNVMKTYILHPDSNNGGPERVISVREAALIMGFRKSFSFPKGIGMTRRYQMIADSVSPVFSFAVARAVKNVLTSKEEFEKR